MIQLVSMLLLAVVLGTTGFVWQTAFGFYPLEAPNWQWLLQYIAAYHQLPTFIFWSIPVDFAAFLALFGAFCFARNRVGSRNISGKRGMNSLHGTAHWATKKDVKEVNLFRKTGVVVGGWPSTFRTRTLRHDGPEHVLTFAPTRSGKGVGLVLPTLLSWPASALVLDIKGENWRLTSGWRASMGQRILKFDPTAETGSIRFNPLAEIRIGTDYEFADSQNIASMIVDPEGKGLRDFFMKEGFAWLTAAVLHTLYRVRVEENRCASLKDVSLSFGSEDKGLREILGDMIAYDHGRQSANEFIRSASREMLDTLNDAPAQATGVLASAKTETRLYQDPILAANIGESDFRLEDLMNGDRPASLYLVVPPSDIDRLRPLLRIMMNLFMRRLMPNIGAEGKSTYKHRLLLMLDEFTSIGKLEIFDRSLGFMGGYGMKAFLIVQDLQQITATYGRENGIIGNCHVQIAFAPNDVGTAKTLSEKCGTTTIVQVHKDRSRKTFGLVGNVTERINEVSRPLLTADECMRLKGARKSRRNPSKIIKPGEMLIFVAGQPPILGRQPLYFQDKTLLRRSKMEPVGASASIDDGGGETDVASSGPVVRAGDAIRAAASGSPLSSSTSTPQP